MVLGNFCMSVLEKQILILQLNFIVMQHEMQHEIYNKIKYFSYHLYNDFHVAAPAVRIPSRYFSFAFTTCS